MQTPAPSMRLLRRRARLHLRELSRLVRDVAGSQAVISASGTAGPVTDLRVADFAVAEGDVVRPVDNDWLTGTVRGIDGGEMGRCCAFVAWSDGSAHWHKVYTLRLVP